MTKILENVIELTHMYSTANRFRDRVFIQAPDSTFNEEKMFALLNYIICKVECELLSNADVDEDCMANILSEFYSFKKLSSDDCIMNWTAYDLYLVREAGVGIVSTNSPICKQFDVDGLSETLIEIFN